MKLPYRPYRVRLYHGEPYTTVWRPTAQIILHGLLGSVKVNALVDPARTRQCFLGNSPMPWVSWWLIDGRAAVRGVGGSPVIVYPGDAELEIASEGEIIRWRAAIRFGPGNHALLGQLGALEFFTATFDHYRRFFELAPNERYPSVA